MAIQIKRDEATLSITLDSGIGWMLNFTHSENSPANAEAWRRHLQAEADKQESFKNNEIDRLKWTANDLRSELATERRRVAALRGVIAKRKAS